MGDNERRFTREEHNGLEKGKMVASEGSMKRKVVVEGSASIGERPENIFRRARIYQEHMKKIDVPRAVPNTLECKTWEQLGLGIEELYKQPLHYLTHAILKQWDKARVGGEDGNKPLGEVIDPQVAQAAIWFAEQIHRRTTSHLYLTSLWHSDPNYVNFC